MHKRIMIWSILISLVLVTVAAQAGIEVQEPNAEDGLELGCNLPTVGFESGLPPLWATTATTHLKWKNSDNCDSDLVPPVQNWTGGSGNAMCINSDAYFYEDYDAELISNAFTIPTDATAAALDYKVNYQDLTTELTRDYLDFDISIDGGINWINLLQWNEDHGSWGALPGEDVTIDLAPYVGQTVNVRWRYYDLYDLSWDWYAQVDEVQVTCDNVLDYDYSDLTPTITGIAWHADPNPRTLWLGPVVDNDNNGLEGTDFITNDGVSVEGDWLPGESVTLLVNVSGSDGWFSGWVDWNSNGIFENPAERVLDEAVTVGDNTLAIAIPADFDPATKIVARFRLYAREPAQPITDSTASPTGGVSDGEVEDYIWNRNATAVQLAQFTGSSTPSWFIPALALAAILLLALPVAYVKVVAKNRKEQL